MLDQQEMSNRFDFYRTVFGEDRMRSSIFPDKLWPVSSYDRKIRGLTERGFKDPRKMIASSPQILGLSLENIDEKIRGLTERGFKDPRKMIATFPQILGYSLENIDRKIRGLTERGFKDPQKMIASLPAILGYSLENIDRKIRGLTERGFKDPRKMIASLPAVLGLSFENIDRKMKLCRRLNVCIDDFIACTIVFIGMSAKHYIPILRKCRELGLEPTPRTVFKVYRSKTF
ncbi:MAG: hypothetical protein A3D67_01730 [Candidatus Lloydbacteria bacterium RIFCSPHIGHO2_02_FULL_51_22]|uniref:Uncharacterized protein n=1 Tax=Candidatus Lloydbacteria bacterium RIFCSPHIGHO2_02_FULL_51_22 TaxID=1798663 RepID=A0A1G2DI03_9BACT|nr:MAG: hypothetical protein A3D67_01730 [Candidatus Lloydbacteria bacterium RIFCSPHIGHO2_02_FULL_51_22]